MSGPVRIDAERGIVYGSSGRPYTVGAGGYVSAWLDGRCIQAHRAVWQHVHGPIPAGLEINHINGRKDDNRIANLELVTHSENLAHAYRTGLSSAIGESHPGAKLTAAQVLEIRRARAGGEVLLALATRFGVSVSLIHQIEHRKTWAHLPETEAAA